MLPPSISQVSECICALIKSLAVLKFSVTWYWETNQGGKKGAKYKRVYSPLFKVLI